MAKLIGPTALQRHASFFDTDGDGFVTPIEVRARLEGLGISAQLSAFFAVLVCFFLGRLTRQRWSLRVSVKDIHRGTHPFDTGTFNARGDFDRLAFEAVFRARDTGEPRDRLTLHELRAFVVRRGDPSMPFGPVGSVLARLFSLLEAKVLFCLASDCHKLERGESVEAISQRNLERFVRGSLFYLLTRRRRIRLALEG